MKRFLSILLSVAMMMAMTACGGTTSTTGANGSNGDVISLKFGHATSESHFFHVGRTLRRHHDTGYLPQQHPRNNP